MKRVWCICLFGMLSSVVVAQCPPPIPVKCDTYARLRIFQPAGEAVKNEVATMRNRADLNDDQKNAQQRAILLKAAQKAQLQALFDIHVERTANIMATMAPMRRSNIHYGASGSAAGTTSLLEKAGLPDFLSYAIEHGAIEKDVNGTSLTLSASVYSLLRLGDIDPPAGGSTVQPTASPSEFWKGFGGSVTFGLQNNPDAALQNLSTKDISEWSIKAVINKPKQSNAATKLLDKLAELYSGNSAYATEIQRRENVARDFGAVTLFQQFQTLDQRPVNISSRATLESFGFPGPKIDAVMGIVTANTQNLLSLTPESFTPAMSAATVQQIDVTLRQIYDNTKLQFSDRALSTSEVQPVLTALGLTVANAAVAAVPLIKKATDAQEQGKMPLFSSTYTNHVSNQQGVSDYSELKILADWDIPIGHKIKDLRLSDPENKNPFSLLLNVDSGISFYQNPSPGLNQRTVRDYHLTSSLGGTVPSFFQTQKDLSLINYSLQGKVEKFREKGTDIGVFQAKVEIPITAGVSFPISFSWASRTELINESVKRGNFGFTFDPQTLLGLRKLIGL